jgi:WAS protein family homolog 1
VREDTHPPTHPSYTTSNAKSVHFFTVCFSLNRFSEASQVTALSQRVEACQAQVNALAGQSRASTVFASPKYPAPAVLSALVPLSGEGLERFRRARHLDYALDAPHEPADVRPSVALPELLLFGGVDTPPHPALVPDAKPLEGLGRLPSNLPSVSSLLLFNTDHTPYEQYMTLDNLLGRDRSGETRQTNAELFAAPRTVTDGDTMPEAAMLDYTYAPALEELPAMSLPSALPNLPGVADIQWSGASDDTLAPSGSKRGGDRAWADGPRPQPAANGAPAAKAATPGGGASTAAAAAAPSAASAAAAPPPPPPPPSSGGAAAPVSAGGAPPPPPPPKAKAVSFAAETAASPAPAGDDAGGGDDDGGGGGDTRNALLESIRAGRKLKKVAERKKVEEEEDKKPAKHGAGSTGDIMGDLMQALNRRRKGIASKQVAKAESMPNIGRVVAPPKLSAPKNENVPEHDDAEWSDGQ